MEAIQLRETQQRTEKPVPQGVCCVGTKGGLTHKNPHQDWYKKSGKATYLMEPFRSCRQYAVDAMNWVQPRWESYAGAGGTVALAGMPTYTVGV